jgi:hypothetical protein
VATEEVRLGTAVLIAALHTPVQLAKALATVDCRGTARELGPHPANGF